MPLLRPLVLALVLTAAALPAHAQEQEQPWRADVRRAYEAYEAVLYDPPQAPREGDHKDYVEAVRAWQTRRVAALDVFVETFERSPWDAWSPDSDDRLLETALLSLGDRAYEKGEGDRAIRAYEMLVTKLPAVRQRLVFPVRNLPLSYVLAGRVEEGRRRIDELLEIASDMYKPRLLVLAGDMECLLGRPDAARALYRRCWESVPQKLKECCGTEADAARDAWVKLTVMSRKLSLAGAEWTDGRVPPPRPGTPRVVTVIDVYRAWDVSLTGRLQTLLAPYPDVLAGSVALTFAEDTGDAQPSGAQARKPRYDDRGPVRMPPQARAAEVRRNLSWSIPVLGLPAHRLPYDLWTGDYDVVVADETGTVSFVRGHAEDRTVLLALLDRARR